MMPSFDQEARFLRRFAFVFPVLASLLGMAWLAAGWKFVVLDATIPTAAFSRAWLLRILGLALLGGLFPLVWWAFLRGEQRAPVLRRWPVAPLFALLVVVSLELIARAPQVQGPFWLGVRARLRPGAADYFIYELAYLRLDVLDAARREQRGKQIFVGSSQVLQGIDFALMQALSAPTPVLRRAVAGMDPVQACGAQEFLSVRKGDRVVFHLSEVDMTGSRQLQPNWMRALTTARGWVDVVRCMDPSARCRNMRGLADLAASAVSELWRVRDYARYVLLHPFGNPGRLAAPQKPDAAAVAEAMRLPEGQERDWYEMNFRAFEVLVRRINEKGARALVFEGHTNPSIESTERLKLREETRRRMTDLAGRIGFDYVPQAEQTVRLEREDWLDLLHLNAAGREKLTRYEADYLLRHSEAGPAPSP